MAPFETPWLTFVAWIVIAGSVVMAILWSVLRKPTENDR